jgi:hypothetical protein
LNLKEARILQARLKKELAELRSQRDSVSVVEMMPTEDFHDYINETPEDLCEKIDSVIDKLIAVEDCIRKANTKQLNISEYPEIQSIGELVARVIQLRQEAKYYRSMASKPKREKASSGFRSVSDGTVMVTTIGHDMAVEKSQQLTLECEKMSLLIEKIDMETEVDCQIG